MNGKKATFLSGQSIRIKKVSDDKNNDYHVLSRALNMHQQPHDWECYTIIKKDTIENDTILYHVAINNIPQRFILIWKDETMYYESNVSATGNYTEFQPYKVDVVLA